MGGPRSQTPTDKIAILQKTELFANLPREVLSKIAEYALIRHLRRGQILFSEHEEALALYVIAQGEIRSIRQLAGGREQVLSTERTGAVLSVAPLFNGGKFYSTTIADAPSVVLSIGKKEIQQLCRRHTEVLWNFIHVLTHTVRHYAELVEMLALRNVEQRVAQYLLIISHERGVRVGEGCTVELTATRPEIASQLASTREAVSRALADLQRLGLIQLQGRRLVHIPQPQQLGAFAGIERPQTDMEPVTLSSAWV